MLQKHILKKLYFYNEPTNNYVFYESNSADGSLVGSFLTDSYNSQSIRNWFSNSQWISLEKNMIALEKRNDSIIFSNIYDDSESKFEFVVSREIFKKILDEWEFARAQQKEYIVIEVFDDNQVRIYGTDVVNN